MFNTIKSNYISFGVLLLLSFLMLPATRNAQAVEAIMDEPIVDGGPICDYAAPPMGCNYVPGPGYDPKTSCGMVLSCAAPTINSGSLSLSHVNVTPYGYVGLGYIGNTKIVGSAPYGITMTPDGKYVMFTSTSSNLVDGDINDAADVFVRDVVAKTTTMVSVKDKSTQGNLDSNGVAITPDGRYIVFITSSSLVESDTNDHDDIYVRDMLKNTTERVSIGDKGQEIEYNPEIPYKITFDSQNSPITKDGRYIVFSTTADNLIDGDKNGLSDIFVRDMIEGTTERVNIGSKGEEANGNSQFVAISDDGKVLFNSYADNLLAGDKNGSKDVFLRDTTKSTTTLVSVTNLGSFAGFGNSNGVSMTPDGRYVLFNSTANQLLNTEWVNTNIHAFVRDVSKNSTKVVPGPKTATSTTSVGVAISEDGARVLFSQVNPKSLEEGADAWNLYTYDGISDKYLLISVDEKGLPIGSSFPSMSADGSYAIFLTSIPSLKNTYNHVVIKSLGGTALDPKEGEVVGAEAMPTASTSPSSTSTNNVINVGRLNAPANNISKTMGSPWAVSNDGQTALFYSEATNLVDGDIPSYGPFALEIEKAPYDHIFLYTYKPPVVIIKDPIDPLPPVCPVQYVNKKVDFSFCYSKGFVSAAPSRGSIVASFTTTEKYKTATPLITVSKGTSVRDLSTLYNSTILTYKKVLRNTMKVTSEIERTTAGVAVKQLHFTGKVGGVEKVFIVSYIKNGTNLYVISANGGSQFATTMDTFVDTIISSWIWGQPTTTTTITDPKLVEPIKK